MGWPIACMMEMGNVYKILIISMIEKESIGCGNGF